MTIKFYYSPQSNAARIRVTLEELGIPHETVKIDLKSGDQKKPAFLALNPNGKVPTIVIDGTPMFESLAIQIALGERFGVEKGLWPALGSADHLQALTWITWSQVTLAGAVVRYFMNTADFFPAELHNAKQAEAALAETHTCFRILNERLSSRPYLVGERCTLADIDAGSVLGWAVQGLKIIDIATYPHLAAWLGRVMERPAMQRALKD
jgi:glutathione S-transferase